MSLEMGFSRLSRGVLVVTAPASSVLRLLFEAAFFGNQSALKFFLVHLWALILIASVAPGKSILLNLWNALVGGMLTVACKHAASGMQAVQAECRQ